MSTLANPPSIASGTESALTREVREFCRRVLGNGLAAESAAREAIDGWPERVTALGRAARECRRQVEGAGTALEFRVTRGTGTAPGSTLAERVSAEVALANYGLPNGLREALVLRELFRLSYAQISLAMSVEPAALASVLARARLMLRSELRGGSPTDVSTCADRRRALWILARRQDSEPLRAADDEWIHAHLAECTECGQAHAAMLEASVSYRSWRSGA